MVPLIKAIPCTIRAARPNDVPDIRDMKRRLAIAEGQLHAINASEADWHAHLFGPAPRFVAFVAQLPDAAIGMVILSERFFPGWTSSVLHVNDIFVVPERRGRGVGRALLARAAEEAIRRRATSLALDARQGSRARRLYRKAGFVRIHNHAAYVLAGSALSRLADVIEVMTGVIS